MTKADLENRFSSDCSWGSFGSLADRRGLTSASQRDVSVGTPFRRLAAAPGLGVRSVEPLKRN